jgi:hypothetical protein
MLCLYAEWLTALPQLRIQKSAVTAMVLDLITDHPCSFSIPFCY